MIDYKKTIEDLRNADNLTADHKLLGVCARAADAIDALQAQLPKRGKWVRKENKLAYWYVCSECGYRPHSENYPYLSDFCPNCGAKMTEVQDG